MVGRGINLLLGNLPASLIGAVAVLLLTWYGVRLLDRRPPRLCPGPRERWWRRMLPLAWVWRARPCGYDLSGLHFAGPSRVAVGAEHVAELTCPECGRHLSHPSQLLRRVRRFKPGAAAAIAALVAAVLWNVGDLRRWRWLQHMPTLALVAVERGLGPSTPDPVLGTVANRCSSAPGLTPCEAEILLPRLIADLRNDEISGNAERAIWLLRSLARRVPSATRALEATLDSPDWQQRQLACYVLGELPLYAPSTRMLEVSVEALADDQLPYASGSKAGAESFTDVDNGRRALRTLARHAELAASMLEHALAGGDPQQRRFAAAAIAAGRIERLYPEAMPVLVESLDDRKVAVPALMLAGEGALVHLEPALHAPGKSRAAQARRIIQYILAAARAEKGDAKAIDRLPHLWTEAAYGQAWLTKDVLNLSR